MSRTSSINHLLCCQSYERFIMYSYIKCVVSSIILIRRQKFLAHIRRIDNSITYDIVLLLTLLLRGVYPRSRKGHQMSDHLDGE